MKRSKPLRRTGKLRQRSKKRSAYYRETRVPLVKKILADRPHCEAGERICPQDERHQCQLYSCDVHEIVRRSQGGSLEDEGNLLAVCRLCHDWIGAHPKKATEMGLSARSTSRSH